MGFFGNEIHVIEMQVYFILVAVACNWDIKDHFAATKKHRRGIKFAIENLFDLDCCSKKEL